MEGRKWRKVEVGSMAFELLYRSSALTWEGLLDDDGNLDAVYEWFEDNGFEPVDGLEFIVYKGVSMNMCYNLTGSNAYPDDTTFVSVMLEDLKGNMAHMAVKRFEVGARWFDDIVDNNSRKQEEMEMDGWE